MEEHLARKKAKECFKRNRKLEVAFSLNQINVKKYKKTDGKWEYTLYLPLRTREKKYLVEIDDKTGECTKFEKIEG